MATVERLLQVCLPLFSPYHQGGIFLSRSLTFIRIVARFTSPFLPSGFGQTEPFNFTGVT